MSKTLTKRDLKLYGQILLEKNDFPEFCSRFIPEEKYPYKWYDHLNDIWEFIKDKQKAMLLAPRGHGKSVTFKTAFALFEALKNRDITIGIVSNNEDTVEEMIKPIIQFSEKPKIIEVFGKLKNEKKTVNNEFEILGSKKPVSIPEPTISVYSSGSGKIIGKHFDLLIIDDIVTQVNAQTEHSRKKLKDWFNNACLPTLRKGGKLLIIGTRYHPSDLYGTLLKDTFKALHIRCKAIQDDRTALCEDLFSIEELEEIQRQLGKIAFNAQFQNDTKAMQEGNLVQPESLQYYQTRNPDKANYIDFNDNKNSVNYRFIQTIDLATGSKSGDYSACAMVAYNTKTKEIFVDDIIIKRCKVSEFKQDIRKQYQKYRKYYPQSFCESNGFQTAILQDLNSTFGDMRIREIKNTRNKEARFIAVLSPVFDDMKVYLNKHCVYMQLLEEQLLSLTPTGSDIHDDAPDALCMAIEQLPRIKHGKRIMAK